LVPGPTACSCCGSDRLSKIGEDVTETLEVMPRQWKVIQTVREKFTCRVCEKVSQSPAPFHAVPRGLYGAGLLAMVLFEKYGQHQPLNRQSRRYAHEGVELSLPTLADMVGTCAKILVPLHDALMRHVLAAERLHGDDTTVPVLAPNRTRIGRLWVYVRDDRPYAGPAPPAAVFFYSPDRRGEHSRQHLAHYTGILRADAYDGFNGLYDPARPGGLIVEAACWAHGRRKFFELCDPSLRKPGLVSPLALQAVKRIDALFTIEHEINGRPEGERLAVRRERSAPLVAELQTWMKAERARLSRHADVAKALDYIQRRRARAARGGSGPQELDLRRLRCQRTSRRRQPHPRRRVNGSSRGSRRRRTAVWPLRQAGRRVRRPTAGRSASGRGRVPGPGTRRIIGMQWAAPGVSRASASTRGRSSALVPSTQSASVERSRATSSRA